MRISLFWDDVGHPTRSSPYTDPRHCSRFAQSRYIPLLLLNCLRVERHGRVTVSHVLLFARLPFSFFLVTLLEPSTHCSSKRSHDAEGASNNVSKSHGDKIFREHLSNGNFRSTKDSERNDEHVGDTGELKRRA